MIRNYSLIYYIIYFIYILFFFYFIFSIAPDCHLCLANYNLSSLNNQKCSFISPHHATIFYDDWTQHYELINYSEYGTCVDGIIYGNDIDRKLIYIPESYDLVHRVCNLVKTAPRELSPNYQASSLVSELCASPPKHLMKMLSKRHEAVNDGIRPTDIEYLAQTTIYKYLPDDGCSSTRSFSLLTVELF
ncbi:unnamed protein product [Schistosoma margrebowiei]|uniref:FHA domain-containing protein n=1 Tax=Schistosoma margrebowiei TaxID=48269 RepID=A0A3P8DZ86_9TREM|nr:unnamed protein product [Schistosoma margrebowiei]